MERKVGKLLQIKLAWSFKRIACRNDTHGPIYAHMCMCNNAIHAQMQGQIPCLIHNIDAWMFE